MDLIVPRFFSTRGVCVSVCVCACVCHSGVCVCAFKGARMKCACVCSVSYLAGQAFHSLVSVCLWCPGAGCFAGLGVYGGGAGLGRLFGASVCPPIPTCKRDTARHTCGLSLLFHEKIEENNNNSMR